jgi:serine/threonine-protein kinase
VVVDGRPLGLTPQRVRVAPGPHSVLFVHPELGRASRSVNVASGGNHTVAVQLGE